MASTPPSVIKVCLKRNKFFGDFVLKSLNGLRFTFGLPFKIDRLDILLQVDDVDVRKLTDDQIRAVFNSKIRRKFGHIIHLTILKAQSPECQKIFTSDQVSNIISLQDFTPSDFAPNIFTPRSLSIILAPNIFTLTIFCSPAGLAFVHWQFIFSIFVFLLLALSLCPYIPTN